MYIRQAPCRAAAALVFASCICGILRLNAAQAQPISSIEDGYAQVREIETTTTAIALYYREMAAKGEAPLSREVRTKQQWLESLAKQMQTNVIRASNAKADDAALSDVYLREARAKRDTAYRLIEQLAGREIAQSVRATASAGLPPPRPNIEANIRHTEEVRRDFLGALGDKITQTAAQLGKNHPQVRELEARYERLSTALNQVHDAYSKAQQSKSSGEEAFYRKVASSMEDSINRLAHGVFDKSPYPDRAYTGGTGPGLLQGMDKPILEQQGILLNYKLDAPRENDTARIQANAQAAFGEGQAGAGGISLHSPVEWADPPARGSIQRAAFESGRLVLHRKGGPIVLPALDPEYLALAIRSVYGGEGDVQGTLVADEPKMIVIQTGKARYGEVAWNKELLAAPGTRTADRKSVFLPLGPALGLLSQPEPSTDRVTYYGPIQGARMGRTLLDADRIIFTLLTGVDTETARPVPAPPIDGFQYGIERDLVVAAEAAKQKPAVPAPKTAAEASKWWHGGTWYVWVPDRCKLRISDDGSKAEFVSAAMKLAVWSYDESAISAARRALGVHTSEHFAELATAFPALAELTEVAKAVSVVRWLKREEVPVDLAWARGLALQRVETPKNVRRRVVFELRDDTTNLPIIEKASERVAAKGTESKP